MNERKQKNTSAICLVSGLGSYSDSRDDEDQKGPFRFLPYGFQTEGMEAWREGHRFAVGILTKGCTEIPAVTEWLCPIYTET